MLALTSIVSAAPPKVDYFFPAGAQRGTTVDVIVGGTFERWPPRIWTACKGVDVKAVKESAKLAISVAADAEPGVCWIRLYDEQGASVARPFIIGTLPETNEKEPNDDPRKPQALDVPGIVVNGRLDKPGDVDTFALKLSKGQTLVASIDAYRTLHSPMDCVLQVLSADGFVLDQNDDHHSFDPQLAFTVPKDGTYLVRVFAFPAVPDATIRFAGKDNFVYRLTLTTGPFVEYPYPLSAPRTAPGTVELVGWNIPDDLRRFPVMPATGADVAKLFHPRLPLAVFVNLETVPALVKTKATRAEPQTLPMPCVVTGRLDRPGAADVYQVEAKKGQRMSFRIESRTLGFPLDPVLRLTDAAGKPLAQTKASAIGTDTRLDVAAPQDGAYRIEVSDLHSHGGLRYVYRLRAGVPPPDFGLKVASDSFVLAPGKPLDIPVTIERREGFAQVITLQVEGMPKDIAMTQTDKALRLTGTMPFSGPIRILGVAKDGTTRAAQATTVPEPGFLTEQLWLTVLRK